jgi:hypothetical protein
MSPAGDWSGNFKEIYQDSIEITYIFSFVAFEGAVMDLHIGTSGKNGTALEVACPPPGIGAKL